MGANVGNGEGEQSKLHESGQNCLIGCRGLPLNCSTKLQYFSLRSFVPIKSHERVTPFTFVSKSRTLWQLLFVGKFKMKLY